MLPILVRTLSHSPQALAWGLLRYDARKPFKWFSIILGTVFPKLKLGENERDGVPQAEAWGE
jgi:hypothetical protein